MKFAIIIFVALVCSLQLALGFVVPVQRSVARGRGMAMKSETEAMKKTELLDSVVEKTGVTKVTAGKILSAFTESIAESLAAGKKVSLMGFGTFDTSVRSARTARNPRTGEPIQVPETTVASFSPSKVLKDKINHRSS